MTVFDRIKNLADKRGISVSKVAIDLGFSENLFYQWKKASPKSDRLEKVANYFDVSVDYLLGRTDDPTETEKDNGPGADLVGYFRINTANLPKDDVEGIEQELKEYMDYLVSKVDEHNKKK